MFFILLELDCKELSVLMVAESICQAYFLHELIPCVLALHRNPTWRNTWNLFMKERSLFYELKYFMCPFNWVFCVNLLQQIVDSKVFFILHELDCKELSELKYFMCPFNCVLPKRIPDSLLHSGLSSGDPVKRYSTSVQTLLSLSFNTNKLVLSVYFQNIWRMHH